MDEVRRLPAVAEVGVEAPFRWLGQGWRDLWTAPGPCLAYGIGLFLISCGLAAALYSTGAITWIGVLSGGFFLIAPMLAMGLYEAGRQIERGDKPSLSSMLFVRGAFRQDLFYLGLALLIIYLFWGRMAQLVYALSTTQLHRDMNEFLTFMFTTSDGLSMALAGTVVGGIIAFIAFALVVISAPMMLDRDTDVWIATVTSVRSVLRNMTAMLLWAGLIALLVAIGIATAFIGLIVVFPWIGLATWRAYRDLVPSGPPQP